MLIRKLKPGETITLLSGDTVQNRNNFTIELAVHSKKLSINNTGKSNDIKTDKKS